MEALKAQPRLVEAVHDLVPDAGARKDKQIGDVQDCEGELGMCLTAAIHGSQGSRLTHRNQFLPESSRGLLLLIVTKEAMRA